MSGDQYRAGSKVEGLFVQGLNGSGWLACESGGIASWWQGRGPTSRQWGQSSRGAKMGAPGRGGRYMHPGRPMSRRQGGPGPTLVKGIARWHYKVALQWSNS